MTGVPAARLSIEIVAEIARLQQDLDKAKRAVDAAASGISKSVGAANDNFGRMTKMSGNAAFAMRNLGFQVQDVITQLSLGQDPMKVFAAQGFQITDALSQMRAEAAKTGQSMTSMIAGSFGKLGPLILAAAAAAAVFAAGLGLVTEEINKTSAVTVTWQDVLLGTFDVVSAAVSSTVTSAFQAMGLDIGQVWESIKRFTKSAINFIIGANLAVPKLIAATYDKIGPAFGDAFYSAANLAIEALNWLAQKSAAPLNLIIDGLNTAFGTEIPRVVIKGLDKIVNPYAGAMAALGSAGAKALTSAFTTDYVGNIASALSDASQNRARLRKAAEDGGKDAGKAGGKAGGRAAGEAMADEWAKALEQISKDLSQSMAGLGKGLGDWLKDWEKAADVEFEGVMEGIQAKRDAEERLREANAEWAEQERQKNIDAANEIANIIGGMGGLFGDIGSILTSKNPIASMLGMGGVGTILGSVLDGGKTVEQMGLQFSTALRETFGVKGELADSIGGVMANVFQGAAIGGSIGELLFKGSKTGRIAAQIGGAMAYSAATAVGADPATAAVAASIASAIYGAIGKALAGTPRGGATIGAGGVMGTWGNSKSRIETASGIGGNAVDALSQLANALGVNLGSFSSSVSVRKGNLRFDPTGSGISKTGKGAIDFGKDEAALLAAIIKDAISDGAFEGLSEGFKKYLTSGDVESRLQDVLNLKGVMNEAAQLRDPQGFALGELDKWRTSMLAIATATGEGMADIEYVYGKRREDILAAVNDNIADLTKERTGLLIQIAELEGRSTEALAMARELERSEADESLRPLYDRIYALQDEQTAAAAAAQAAAELAQAAQQAADEAARLQEAIANEAYGLTTKLLQLQGDTAALRQRELDALNPANRALQEMIFALEDTKTAADLAAESQRKIEQERIGLETRLLQIQGDTAALRQRELDALNPANRALQEMIFALEDTATAAAEAAKAAEDFANAQRAIADEAFGLGRQWLEATGQTDKLRELTLIGLKSDEAREIQKQIWAYQDQQKVLETQAEATRSSTDAAQEYAAALEAARSKVKSLYETQRGELEATRNQFAGFATTIREFRLGLIAANDNSVINARQRFIATASGARRGDSDAVSAFAGDAQRFLDSSLSTARTRADYRRDVAFVAAKAMEAETSLNGSAAVAARQLAALEALVKPFLAVEENTETLADAIAELQAISANAPITAAENINDGLNAVADKIETAADRQAASEALILAALEAIARSTGSTDALLRVLENNGSLAISTRSGDTVETLAA